MPNPCVQYVQNLRTTVRTTCAQLSTHHPSSLLSALHGRVKPLLIRTFPHIYAQCMSTGIFATLPLYEHYFYPLSTYPTITETK